MLHFPVQICILYIKVWTNTQFHTPPTHALTHARTHARTQADTLLVFGLKLESTLGETAPMVAPGAFVTVFVLFMEGGKEHSAYW